MAKFYDMRLTVAMRVKAESPEQAYDILEASFKHMLENRSYQKVLTDLGIEFDAYSIAEVKRTNKDRV